MFRRLRGDLARLHPPPHPYHALLLEFPAEKAAAHTSQRPPVEAVQTRITQTRLKPQRALRYGSAHQELRGSWVSHPSATSTALSLEDQRRLAASFLQTRSINARIQGASLPPSGRGGCRTPTSPGDATQPCHLPRASTQTSRSLGKELNTKDLNTEHCNSTEWFVRW